MTLPPLIVCGTGSFRGPFQNSSGSAGAVTAGAAAPASPAALTWAKTPKRTAKTIRLCTRNIEAVVKRCVAAVPRNDLHLALRVRDEPKRNHRIRTQRDIRIEMKYLPAVVRCINRTNESRGCEIPRDLVH